MSITYSAPSSSPVIALAKPQINEVKRNIGSLIQGGHLFLGAEQVSKEGDTYTLNVHGCKRVILSAVVDYLQSCYPPLFPLQDGPPSAEHYNCNISSLPCNESGEHLYRIDFPLVEEGVLFEKFPRERRIEDESRKVNDGWFLDVLSTRGFRLKRPVTVEQPDSDKADEGSQVCLGETPVVRTEEGPRDAWKLVDWWSCYIEGLNTKVDDDDNLINEIHNASVTSMKREMREYCSLFASTASHPHSSRLSFGRCDEDGLALGIPLLETEFPDVTSIAQLAVDALFPPLTKSTKDTNATVYIQRILTPQNGTLCRLTCLEGEKKKQKIHRG
eukprot:gb/GECG01015176.1/.p1 GENE.gb/GECG01015176.1/~~gb/GECG01015176.1/.p1  ORF type:complete len:330 (+),score=38.64 gb/GECG01015176.1/:1-990(+)